MHIPADYAAILAAVREGFPGFMIAGGAMRDWTRSSASRPASPACTPYLRT